MAIKVKFNLYSGMQFFGPIYSWLMFICGTFELGAQNLPIENCRTLRDLGNNSSELFEINTPNGRRKILCDQELNGGGWTIIQQRVDGSEVFWNKTWQEYKNGFGKNEKNSSFYAGNELIHFLSNQYKNNVTLRIEIYEDRSPNSTHENDFYFSEYIFKLEDESSDFTMEISMNPDWNKRVGNASNGWYDITYSNGIKFSTIDHINDPDADCQKKFHLGGWWTHYCGLASLNGEYEISTPGSGYGFFFVVWGHYTVNPKRSRMLIRDRENE